MSGFQELIRGRGIFIEYYEEMVEGRKRSWRSRYPKTQAEKVSRRKKSPVTNATEMSGK